MSSSEKVGNVQSTLDHLDALSDEAAASHLLAHSLSMVSTEVLTFDKYLLSGEDVCSSFVYP